MRWKSDPPLCDGYFEWFMSDEFIEIVGKGKNPEI